MRIWKPAIYKFHWKNGQNLEKSIFNIFLLFSATIFSESRDYSLIRLYVFGNPLVIGFTVKNGQNLKKKSFFKIISALWYRQNNVRIVISVVSYFCKLIFIEIGETNFFNRPPTQKKFLTKFFFLKRCSLIHLTKHYPLWWSLSTFRIWKLNFHFKIAL